MTVGRGDLHRGFVPTTPGRSGATARAQGTPQAGPAYCTQPAFRSKLFQVAVLPRIQAQAAPQDSITGMHIVCAIRGHIAKPRLKNALMGHDERARCHDCSPLLRVSGRLRFSAADSINPVCKPVDGIAIGCNPVPVLMDCAHAALRTCSHHFNVSLKASGKTFQFVAEKVAVISRASLCALNTLLYRS